MRDTLENVWEKVLDEISSQIPPRYYENFISPLALSEISENRAVITAPSQTVKSHVEKKYFQYIENAFFNVSGNRLSLEIHVNAAVNAIREIADDKFSTENHFQFNPDYTFENYIVGESNKFAFFAAKETASRNGDINPLYIFGNVGTGKTHLLHAIGSTIQKESPWKKVKYVDILSFMNEFTYHFYSRQSIESFKLKYQSYDVLIVDDIQYLNSSAEKTQEEFFFLFNHLYDRKRQIVIASDRPSSELPIHERLKSRFVTGVQVDVKLPDFATKVKILAKYADTLNLNLTEDQLNRIARDLQGDTRTLIGSLNDLHLYKKSSRLLFLTDETVDQIVSLRASRGSREATSHETLIDIVSEKFGQHKKDILGKSRKKEFIIPRHICMYILHEVHEQSKSVIGRIFNTKHTAVIHAIKNISKLVETDTEIRNIVTDIKSKVQFR